MTVKHTIAAVAVVAAGLTSAVGPRAQTRDVPAANPAFNEQTVQSFRYRNLGPFRIGARTSDIAVPASPARDHLYTWYVSFWTGGLWKTTNNGTTFEPMFDAQAHLAIGAVAIAPSNPNIVWVGTGDAFTSRSSYRGDGVYKSIDAGHTWKNMGLPDSHHISRIRIDPVDPNVVYVAAMGHLYSDNAERGVFKTTDGGATWTKVLYLNERVGVIDLVMNPKTPTTLYAAMYDKQRMPWQIVNGGPGTGIHKTTDGGKTWTKLGGGLPTGRLGRIGLDIYLKNPDILYAVIENENPKPAGAAPAAPGRAGGAPPAADPTVGGELYRTANGGQTWTKMNADDYNVSPKGPYYFSQIRVDPTNDQNIFVTQDGYRHSTDGGKTWNGLNVFPRMFGDYRTLWIDPENSDRMISGSDGGISVTYDGGRSCDAFANIPVGEIYSIGFDMEDPYNIYAGLQDHEHWRGPTQGPLGRVTPQDWYAIGDNDGIMTQVDPTDSRWVYTTRQYGGQTRVDQKNGYETNIWPQRPAGAEPYRFLWSLPISISPHDSKVIYTGAEVLLKSTDRGDHWSEISPDLSTNDRSKILRESEGGVPGGIPWLAISMIAESPLTKGEIWVGTADGKVQLTRNDGAQWTDLTPKLTAAGARADIFVSRVRASSHVKGRAYVSKSGYKFDDFRPFLFTTDDYGATWRSIAANLPQEPINVVWEDAKNPDLLFVGNDTGVFVSITRGKSWVKMNNTGLPGGMPNIPVHDLAVHPREGDLILGTYGRDFWITNITPLQELTEATLAEDVHLFETKPGVQRVTWSFGANDYLYGQRHQSTSNEPNVMSIRYYLKSAAQGGATVTIADAQGQEVARLQGPAAAGINTVPWSMRTGGGGGRGGGGGGGTRGGAGPVVGNAGPAAATAGAAGGRGAGPGGRAGGAGVAYSAVMDQLLPLGEYNVTLTVAGKTLTQKARIAKTMGWSIVQPGQVIR